MAATKPGDVPHDSTDEFELVEEIEEAVTAVETDGLHGHEALHAVMDMLRPDLEPDLEHAVAAMAWRRLTDPEAEHVGLRDESRTTAAPPVLLLEEVEVAVGAVQAEGLAGRPARVEATRRVAEAMGDDADHARIATEVRARLSDAD
jgi:hypothetical protein